MALSAANRRSIILLILVLLIEWLWLFFGRPLPSSPLPPSLHEKISSALKTDVFDYPATKNSAIHSVCAATNWNDAAVFTCDNSVGGIGNIRNSILICTRLAISAGASLVMPKIVVRNAQDIAEIRTAQRTTMDYMFDVPHYKQSLRLSCPGLKLYDSIEDVPNYQRLHGPHDLQPEDLQEHTPTGLPHPETWATDFKNWLNRASIGTVFTTANPSRTTIVSLGRSYLIYPIYSDPKPFAHAFGSILKFRRDVRLLASEVFTNLLSSQSLTWDGHSVIVENAYIGAHLRTEKDAAQGWPAGDWHWSGYEAQAEAYLNQTLGDGLSTIYIASGDLSQIRQFSLDASSHNLTVLTKHSLLSASSLQHLEELAWDQQGLVDFLVMLKASDFAGVAHSSFAWSIALKRHLESRRKDQLHLKGANTLSDELSQVYGQVAGEYPGCVWP